MGESGDDLMEAAGADEGPPVGAVVPASDAAAVSEVPAAESGGADDALPAAHAVDEESTSPTPATDTVLAREAPHAAAPVPHSAWPVSRRTALLLAASVLMALVLHVVGWQLVEGRVRAKLDKVVGPAARWDIHLDASWFDLFSGHIPAAKMVGHDVHTGTGLDLESIDIRLDGVGFAGRTITSLVSATFQARVDEKALTAWFPSVQEHFDQIDAIAVRPAAIELRGKMGDLAIFRAIERRLAHNPAGRAMVETVKAGARKALGGVKRIDLRIRGRLAVRDEVQIHFDVLEVPVLGLPLPGIVCEALGALANPVYDLRDRPFGLRVTRIEPQTGFLVIEGSANPPVPFTP